MKKYILLLTTFEKVYFKLTLIFASILQLFKNKKFSVLFTILSTKILIDI
jgi:hypothetical protein